MIGQSAVSWLYAAGWLLLGLVGVLACAGPVDRSEEDRSAITEPEPIELSGWRRADHHGLVIYTNTPDATAQRVFRQLNRFIDVVNRQINEHPFEAHRRLEIFVFSTRDEYLRFGPKGAAGYAFRGDDETMTALSIEEVFEGTETLFHELVHVVLLNDPDRRFPSWYHEGLAVFFATSVLRGDVLTVGGLSNEYVQLIRAKPPMRLRRLLASPLGGQRNHRLFYADAWAFVHFGLLAPSRGGPDRRSAFANFVARVSRGEPWEPAFLSAFEAKPEEVAHEFERHRQQLSDETVQTLANIPINLDEAAAVFTPMDRLEIGRELAQLGVAGFDAGWDSAALLLDQILEASPDDSAAIYGRIRVAAHHDELDLGETLWNRLSEGQRVGVDAWQAEADLALAHVRSLNSDKYSTIGAENLSRAISGYSRILDEDSDRLSALAGLGRALVLAKHEDPTLGISALERAIAVSPNSPILRLDLAELLIRSGATTAAIAHLDQVMEAYPGSHFAKRAAKLHRKARRLRSDPHSVDSQPVVDHWRRQLCLLRSLEFLAAGTTVDSVALTLGYESTRAFIAMFRRSLGCTPGEYFKTRRTSPSI